jgi:hypothetical protein
MDISLWMSIIWRRKIVQRAGTLPAVCMDQRCYIFTFIYFTSPPPLPPSSGKCRHKTVHSSTGPVSVKFSDWLINDLLERIYFFDEGGRLIRKKLTCIWMCSERQYWCWLEDNPWSFPRIWDRWRLLPSFGIRLPPPLIFQPPSFTMHFPAFIVRPLLSIKHRPAFIFHPQIPAFVPVSIVHTLVSRV